MDERQRLVFGPQSFGPPSFSPPSFSPLPDGAAGQHPDWEWVADVARLGGEMTASRDRPPESWDLDEIWDSGDPLDPDEAWDPGEGLSFGQDDEADVLPPGPLLVGLTEGAISDLGALSDNELTGVLQAARRQQARETYKQVLVMSEFGRRRQAAFEAAKDRGVPVGCRPGGFPGEELAMELVTTRTQAAHRIENAIDLTTRLPATLAGMAAGLIDEDRASYIAYYTHSLNPADAARADAILAAAAPDLRVDQLARKAAALEMKLAPEAARARKEHEKRTNQRVEARREYSGNASLSAREMDTADAMASKAYIDAMAAGLRNGGLDAPLGTLRVLAMTDLTQGRNPLDRLNPRTASGPAAPAPAPAAPGCDVQAVQADLDHTRPYPAGPSDECNLAPRCRTHHRCKQAPDWNVEQPQPGTTHWTLPSGRVHITTPTAYIL